MLLILFSRASYSWGRFFTFIDVVFIAAAFLVFKGKIYTAYAAAAIAGALTDIIVMPFFGFHFFSSLAGVTALWIMTLNLYRDNYITKVFIVAAGEAIIWLFYSLFVFIFHWGFKIHYLSAQVLPKILFTTLAAAAVFKISELYKERFAGWLKICPRQDNSLDRRGRGRDTFIQAFLSSGYQGGVL
jgi:hypothetical protein